MARIVVNDYGGYPYPIQLSRWLSLHGHQVLHIYNKAEPPRGIFSKKESDHPSLEILGIELHADFGKEDFLQRRRFERMYGKELSKISSQYQPDVIVSANSPVETQQILLREARKSSIPFIYWVQDLRGVAAFGILRKRIPVLGAVVGFYYVFLERLQMWWSDQIVLITEAFLPHVKPWVKDNEIIHVIPNWAPLGELPVVPKENPWSEEHQLAETFNFLFAGVLGMKHNPKLLLELATHFQKQDQVRVVVVSRGPGVEWLQKQKQAKHVDNLILIDFQPFERMPQILACGDVLVSILEPEAGEYSVPSKVQTYLCGKKPLLLSVPVNNLVAKIVKEEQAGLIVSPGEKDSFLSSAEKLFLNPELRQQMGKNARLYAENNFDIQQIGQVFDTIISKCFDSED